MRGLYIAGTAMMVQEARLETVSNNLANLRTGGYKRDQAVTASFAEWLLSRKESGTAILPGGGPLVGSMPHGAAVAETWTDFSAGAIEETGRPLDLALAGEGYFQVEGPGGFLYTRNGRFQVNRQWYLVSAEGYRVWGANGPIRLRAGETAVLPDGSILVDGAPAGRVRVADFPPGTRLIKAGNNLFQAPVPAVEGKAEVWSGYLEGSNVDVTREMVSVMEIRRSYEAAQRAFTSCDALLKKAANDLGAL